MPILKTFSKLNALVAYNLGWKWNGSYYVPPVIVDKLPTETPNFTRSIPWSQVVVDYLINEGLTVLTTQNAEEVTCRIIEGYDMLKVKANYSCSPGDLPLAICLAFLIYKGEVIYADVDSTPVYLDD